LADELTLMKHLGLSKAALFGIATLISISAIPTLRADTVWTNWASATVGAPGMATGSLNGVTVSYKGEVIGAVTNGSSADWSNPASSFIGGTVTTSPGVVGDIIFQDGAFTGTNTLSFSSPLVNPVFAIWSLGRPSIAATYSFNAAPRFEAGGPDIYGGGPITVSGNVVSGMEGSGIVQFTGTLTSLSWTNTPEFYYGFTVGEAGTASAVPEPASFALLGASLALFAVLRLLQVSLKRY
jgi:hypothetical protein